MAIVKSASKLAAMHLANKHDRELATNSRRVNTVEREVPEFDWDGIRELPYKRQPASGFAPRQEKYRNVICGLLKILELGHT